ncbi:MAG: hypothetical protein U1E39_13815 [Planctomycetota bacterium]
MADVPPNNSAARRLLNVLKVAEGCQPNMAAHKAWAAAFNLPEGDLRSIYRSLAQLSDLAVEVRDAVKAQPIDQDLHLRWVPFVEGALASANLTQGWESVKVRLSPTNLTSLEFVAHFDRLPAVEPLLPAEVLKELLAETRRLFEVVERDVEDEGLRRDILRRLRGIEKSIIDYRITGARGMTSAAIEATGEAAYAWVQVGGTVGRAALRGVVTLAARICWKVTLKAPLLPPGMEIELGAGGDGAPVAPQVK